MPEKKPQVADSAIADVFEGRHPSAAEKEWAEKTLASTLEKTPEKPIGAPTGTNLDEHGNARFTTISGVPIRRLYTEAALPEDWAYERYRSYHQQPPFTFPTRRSSDPFQLYPIRELRSVAIPPQANPPA